MADFVSKGPSPEVQPSLTDTYFRHTRTIVQEHGDVEVVYAVFMRRPVTFAGRLAFDWLQAMAGTWCQRSDRYGLSEGAWVGAGEPMCYITGPFSVLVDLETILLQRLGAACVAPTTPITCALIARVSLSGDGCATLCRL